MSPHGGLMPDALEPSDSLVAFALRLDEPLSFWGGLDLETGGIIDAHHPQHGRSIAGTVLVSPGIRGSTSSPSVLAEAIRNGVGPVAVVLPQHDSGAVAASTVVEELYGLIVPIIVTRHDQFSSLATGDEIAIDIWARRIHLVRPGRWL